MIHARYLQIITHVQGIDIVGWAGYGISHRTLANCSISHWNCIINLALKRATGLMGANDMHYKANKL
jgi:hypothetical protein